jgi:hypothetical protein
VIAGSTSLADLSQLSRDATGIGSNSLSHPWDLISLAESDPSGWLASPVDRDVFTLDCYDTSLQLATLTHAELAYDRFVRQYASALSAMSSTDHDAHWAAVTCYYAAFFAAQSLLLQVGRGAIRVPRLPSLTFSGVFAVERQASPRSAGLLEFRLRRLGSASHRQTWQQVTRLIDDALLHESAPRPILILQTLKLLIEKPELLSDARNAINYDITSSPYTASRWTSLLLDLTEADEIEDALARATDLKPSQRFELVALGLAALSVTLRHDRTARGGQWDKRQLEARDRTLPARVWFVSVRAK